MKNAIEKIFNLEKNKTDIKREFIAGLITFFAMVYILTVNANMFTNPLGNGENVIGVSYGAIYVATAVSALIGCFLTGLVANLPVALASGMGLNAFFMYTVCLTFGFTYENALATVLVEGLLFLLLALTGGLKKIYDAIPFCVRAAISAGIGLFMALLGLQNAGIIVSNNITGLTLNSFNVLNVPFSTLMPAIVTLVSLFCIAAMVKKNIKGAIFSGILIGVFLYYTLGFFIPDFYGNIHIETLNPINSFHQFLSESFGAVFRKGFDFSAYIAKKGLLNLILVFSTTAISFCLVNIFDNIGSIQAVCEHGNLLDKEGKVQNINRAMTANSLAATIGSIIGTSPVTCYIESTAGIMEGGRTGLTTIFTGLFFLIAMFLSPLAQLVPGCATAAALIYVGTLMMSSVKNIDWFSAQTSIPAFLTICMMPFSYNIANGIAFGLLAYVIISIFSGKIKELKPTTFIVVTLFVLTLLFSH